MKNTNQKLEQARKLTEILVSYSCKQSERYYFVLRIFQNTRKQLNQELDLIRLSKVNKELRKTEGQLYAEAMEEKRAIKEANVTSLTYERAKNRLDKQVERWITG